MTLSESRKKKLQILLRSISRGDMAAAQELLCGQESSGGTGKSTAAADPVPLQQACPGTEQTIATPGGPMKYWLGRRRLAEIAPERLDIPRRYAAVLRGAGQQFDELEASAALCQVANLSPSDPLFVDIETCGFSGTAIFLIGLMFCAAEQLHFEQYLARNYAEEAAILAAFARRLAKAGVLVSFNGKAFDMTMIRERSAFHAVELPQVELPHLDLLHECRRIWRGRLPNCRLQTLESHLCGRHRIGDIHGSDIPNAYHHFVKTSDARRLKDILHHNLMDLLTMAELLCAILTGCDPAVE